MPIATIRALILGTAPYAEQDREVFLLTERGELKKAIAPGAMKGKNRFGSILELFTYAEFSYYWREDRYNWTLSKGDLLQSRFQALSKPDNLFCGVFMAEAVWRFLSHHHEHFRVFRLVQAVLGSFDQGLALRETLAYFMIWLLRIEGLLFTPDCCVSCNGTIGPPGGWLRDDGRGLLCHMCHRQESGFVAADWLSYITWTRRHGLESKDVEAQTLSNRPGYGEFLGRLKSLFEVHGEFRFKTPLL